MNARVSLIIKAVLLVLIAFLGYKLYSIIQDPIDFENLKKRRYQVVKNRLEQIRDVQKVHRGETGVFIGDIGTLVAFVDTGKVAIVERKDSSFMYYDEVYQQDMEKDTVITRVLGFESVRSRVFQDESFDANRLRSIPFSGGKDFIMDAGKIQVNNVVVPVFEAQAPDTLVFHDVLKKYKQYIDQSYALKVGSLNEPTISGNWK